MIKINRQTGAFIAHYAVGGVEALDYDPTQNVIWTANSSANTVHKVDATNGSLINTYAMGASVADVVYDADHNVVSASAGTTLKKN